MARYSAYQISAPPHWRVRDDVTYRFMNSTRYKDQDRAQAVADRLNQQFRKKNPAGTMFYRFSGGGGTYQNIHTARPAAQAQANATGRSVVIESAKGGKAWKRYGTVQPKAQKNPRSIRARKIEIVRNARGQAVKLRIYRA